MMHTYSRPVNTQASIYLFNEVYKSPIELFGRKTVFHSQKCRRLFRVIRFVFLITFTVRGRETYIQDREQRKVIRIRKVSEKRKSVFITQKGKSENNTWIDAYICKMCEIKE